MFQFLETSKFRFFWGSPQKMRKNPTATGSPQKLTIPKAVEKYVHDYHGATPHRAPPVGVAGKTRHKSFWDYRKQRQFGRGVLVVVPPTSPNKNGSPNNIYNWKPIDLLPVYIMNLWIQITVKYIPYVESYSDMYDLFACTQ